MKKKSAAFRRCAWADSHASSLSSDSPTDRHTYSPSPKARPDFEPRDLRFYKQLYYYDFLVEFCTLFHFF